MAFDFSELVKTKTTDELTLVFSKPSNYQPEMVAAATAELTSRNIDLSDLIIRVC